MALTKEDYERCLGEYQKLFERIVKGASHQPGGGVGGLHMTDGEGVPVGRLAAIAKDIDVLRYMLDRMRIEAPYTDAAEVHSERLRKSIQ